MRNMSTRGDARNRKVTVVSKGGIPATLNRRAHHTCELGAYSYDKK